MDVDHIGAVFSYHLERAVSGLWNVLSPGVMLIPSTTALLQTCLGLCKKWWIGISLLQAWRQIQK